MIEELAIFAMQNNSVFPAGKLIVSNDEGMEFLVSISNYDIYFDQLYHNYMFMS